MSKKPWCWIIYTSKKNHDTLFENPWHFIEIMSDCKIPRQCNFLSLYDE